MPEPENRKSVEPVGLQPDLSATTFVPSRSAKGSTFESTIKKLGSHPLLSPAEEYELTASIRHRILRIHRELLRLPEAIELALGKSGRKSFSKPELVSALEIASKATKEVFENGSPEDVQAQVESNYLLLLRIYRNEEINCFGISEMLGLEKGLKQACTEGALDKTEPARQEFLKAIENRVAPLRGEASELKQKLAKHNTRFVLSIVRGVDKRKASELDDLIGAGNLGLWIATERFNPRMGVRFSSYARIWIKREISLQAREDANGLVKLPRGVFDFKRAKNQEKLSNPVDSAQTPSSLRPQVNDGAEYASSGSEEAESLILKEELDEVIQALEGLSEEEFKVLLLRFSDLNPTLKVIGELSGVSRQRVLQIKDKALKKLQKSLSKD